MKQFAFSFSGILLFPPLRVPFMPPPEDTSVLTKEALKAARMSAAELARAIDVTRVCVSAWLNGREPLPPSRAKEIRRILSAATRASTVPRFAGIGAIRPRYLLDDDRRAFRKNASALMQAAMRELGIKPIRLAEDLDVHRVNVHYWTKGKVAIPVPIAVRMGKLLGLDPTTISEQALVAAVSSKAVRKSR